MPTGLIGAGASLLGGVMQSSAASSAADAQTQAANRQIDLQKEIYDQTSQNFSPWLDGGNDANAALLYEMGIGPKPMVGGTAAQVETYQIPGKPSVYTQGGNVSSGYQQPGSEGDGINPGYYTAPVAASTGYRVGGNNFGTMEEAQAYANANKTGATEYGGFQKSPGYDFQFSQGMDALQSTAAARGNLLSGATLQSAQTFGQGLANQDYANWYNRLAGISQSGQAAAGNQANAASNYGQQAGNALAGIGNAQSAGAIAQGNAWSGALNGLSGSFGYMSGQKSTPQSTSGGAWNMGSIW